MGLYPHRTGGDFFCTASVLPAANVFWGHEGRPDRAEGTLYVQSTCMNVQGRLCTVTPKGKPCSRLSARARSTLSRAESTLYVQSTCLDLQRIFCTCKEPLARSSVREIQSIDILVPKIRYRVPHPSNDQNITKTMSFQQQKRRFLDGVQFQDFALRKTTSGSQI